MGEEADFNFKHVNQDIHTVTEQRAREESLKSKDGSRVATSMVVLDTQQCKLCWVFSASRCVCLLFLMFCKHVEGRELDMSLFHVHYHTQHEALGSTKRKPPLATHTSWAIHVSTWPHKPSHLPHYFSRQKSQAGPGPWGIGPTSYPLILGRQYQVSTETNQEKKKEVLL